MLKSTSLKWTLSIFVITTAGLLAAFFLLAGENKGGTGSSKHPKADVPRMSKILEQTDKELDDSSINFPYNQDAPDPDHDKTLSPYFYVAGGDPETDALPLKETSADVNIAGVIANVTIHQVFGNDGDEPIEAVYVFPASTRAAVHAMTMKIGERTIHAKIDKRETAKEKYTTAKSEGKRASLLEQERPNVFTMKVANIMPGDTIKVDVDYTEHLTHEEGVYEFVYPSVVGPRYGGGADPASDEWIENPYLKEGEKEPYKFDINVRLETGIPIRDLKSPSHSVDASYTSRSSASVSLKQQGGGNRDYVLNYRLAENTIESTALLYEHGDENFFVVMMEPPPKPSKSQILPREYIFLLDVSGSMSGFPLDTTKALMKKLLGDLKAGDFLNLVVFAGSSGVFSKKSLPATQDNVNKVIGAVDSLSGGGGTELMDGLRTAYGIKKVGDKNISRTVVVITDGYVGVEAQAFKYIRENLADANLFAFGIGSGVNRYLIEGMARAGAGRPFVVLDAGKAPDEANKFSEYVKRPVLTEIEVAFDGLDVYDAAPAKIPDLMAERPLVIFGKYKGEPSGSVIITGRAGDGKFRKEIKLSKDAVRKENAPIRHLWARKWIETLNDQRAMLPQSKKLEGAITKLGLHYSLLTRFTSFYAIDKVKVNASGKVKTVKQPLPLPAGVSNMAVGKSTPKGSSVKSKFQSLLSYKSPASSPSMPVMAEEAAAPEYKMKKKAKSYGAPPAGGSAAAVTTPGKSAVQAALKKVEVNVNKCAGGVSGTAKVKILISGKTGKVISVKIMGGPFAGTPAGVCIENAVKKAVFPTFSQTTFTVTYPFVIE